jgi:hypothetical protein
MEPLGLLFLLAPFRVRLRSVKKDCARPLPRIHDPVLGTKSRTCLTDSHTVIHHMVTIRLFQTSKQRDHHLGTGLLASFCSMRLLAGACAFLFVHSLLRITFSWQHPDVTRLTGDLYNPRIVTAPQRRAPNRPFGTKRRTLGGCSVKPRCLDPKSINRTEILVEPLDKHADCRPAPISPASGSYSSGKRSNVLSNHISHPLLGPQFRAPITRADSGLDELCWCI